MMPTRTSLKKNLMTACSIGVLAAVVTGCGSSDKGSVSSWLYKAKFRQHRRAQAAAERALRAAKTALQTAETDLAAAEAERDAALAAVTAAETGLD